MGSAPIADARERERKAVAAFQAGKNFTEIAEIVGYTNRGTAYESVMRAIRRETLENVDEIRAGELSRIDKMIEASWPAATAAISTHDADGAPIEAKLLVAMFQNQLQAQTTILKLMERRAKYIGGLESPAQLDVKHEVATADQFAAYLLGVRESFDSAKGES